MYRKGSQGWIKHYDFVLFDLFALQFAYLIAYFIRNGAGNPYGIPLYRNMAVAIELADIAVLFFFETLKNVLKRGYYRELAVTVKHVVLVELIAVLYLFTIQAGQQFSRSVLYLTGVFYGIITYLVRILWKTFLQKKMLAGGSRSLLIVTTKDIASTVIRNIKEHNFEMFSITGMVIIDEDMTGKNICGIPVVAREKTAANYVCREWIDEVFVNVSPEYPYPQKLIDQFMETGVTVHLNLARISESLGSKQLVEKVGNYTVLTTSMNYATTKQAFMKRVLDICGGLVGCIFTGIIVLFVGPAIYLSSPGPIFFSQERVGKNGKKFKMYAVLLVGLISFDFGGLLIGYGTINKSSIYVNTYIEEYEDDEIDYRKVGNRLLMIQLVLTLISIPLFLRGLSYVQSYGMSVMRNIIANSVEAGYMTAAERILFLHLGVFPAMQTCSFIQVFLWAKGKIKGWNLIASIIDLVIVVVSTVGRWEVFYFALAMLCAYI